jgi:dihydroneopterin aldolase
MVCCPRGFYVNHRRVIRWTVGSAAKYYIYKEWYLMRGVHTVKGMNFHAFHGVLEVERELGQVYFVDVAVEFEMDPAKISQKEEPPIRDASIYEITRNVMMENKFRSISSLAGTIARNLLNKYEKALGVTICINRRQLFVPGNLDSSITEVTCTRSDLDAVGK